MSDPESIFTQARIAYYQIKQNYNPQLELTISQSVYWSYEYAKNILKSPFPLAEPLIITSGFTIDYAQNIIKGRFKLLELNLTRPYFINKSHLYLYTKCILKFNHE